MRRVFLSLVLPALFVCNAASAESITVTANITGLAGDYVWGGPSRSALFDLHMRFASIDSATISVTGSGMPGVMETCTINVPIQCWNGPLEAHLVYFFSFEPMRGAAPSGDLGPYGPNSQTLTDTLPGRFSSLDFLLDGAGTLNLDFNGQICPAIYACGPVAFPSVTVAPAGVVLQVTGTPVPEPDELVLLLGAIPLVGGLIRKQRTRHPTASR